MRCVFGMFCVFILDEFVVIVVGDVERDARQVEDAGAVAVATLTQSRRTLAQEASQQSHPLLTSTLCNITRFSKSSRSQFDLDSDGCNVIGMTTHDFTAFWFAKNMHCRAVSSFEGFFLDSVL